MKRLTGLVESKVVDMQTLEESQRQLKSVEAARREANAKVTSAQAAAREATAMMARAEADIRAHLAREKVAVAERDRVRALVDYTKIRAPYSGVITARGVNTGHFLQPTLGTRMEPIFTIVRVDLVRVFVDIPETSVDRITNGTPARIRVPGLFDREFTGQVTRTARALNTDTRTLRVEIDLPNPDNSIRAGHYAVVRFQATTPDALTAPASAIMFADETAYCFRVADGKVEKLRVHVGRADSGVYELLRWTKAGVANAEWQKFAVVNNSLRAISGRWLMVNLSESLHDKSSHAVSK